MIEFKFIYFSLLSIVSLVALQFSIHLQREREGLICGSNIVQFGRGDHGRLGYGRKVTTGHPSEVPINLPPPRNLTSNEAQGRWCAKLVACGGRHTLAIVEWLSTDESEQLIPNNGL